MRTASESTTVELCAWERRVQDFLTLDFISARRSPFFREGSAVEYTDLNNERKSQYIERWESGNQARAGRPVDQRLLGLDSLQD